MEKRHLILILAKINLWGILLLKMALKKYHFVRLVLSLRQIFKFIETSWRCDNSPKDNWTNAVKAVRETDLKCDKFKYV